VGTKGRVEVVEEGEAMKVGDLVKPTWGHGNPWSAFLVVAVTPDSFAATCPHKYVEVLCPTGFIRWKNVEHLEALNESR